jgi:phosphoribosylamine--glycine ligase
MFVFHSGTELVNGKLVTSGGRVLGLTALRENLRDAVEAVYDEAKNIKAANLYYRRDIGRQALNAYL